MRVYLAARYSRRDEMEEIAAQLAGRGAGVTSRWIRGEHEGLPAELCAADDVADIAVADAVIAFTEPEGSPYSRGGRHVEAGIALGLRKPLLVVGPPENIFYSLALDRFGSTEALLGAMVSDPYFGSTWTGICASCGCTEETSCAVDGPERCAWVDERRMYCTGCVIDRQVAKGREW